MQIRFVLLVLAPLLAAGCLRIPSTRAQSQDFLLSFPNRLKPGERVVSFEFNARNSDIVAVNRVPYDWGINMLSEAAESLREHSDVSDDCLPSLSLIIRQH